MSLTMEPILRQLGLDVIVFSCLLNLDVEDGRLTRLIANWPFVHFNLR